MDDDPLNALSTVVEGCRCIDAGDGIVITSLCGLHNPFTGTEIRQVEFVGLLEMLGGPQVNGDGTV